MGKSIQIRDLDDEVYDELAKRAADLGLSVPELLRRQAHRLASRPSIDEWLDRTRRRPSDLTRDEVLDAIDDSRGIWPDARR